MGFLLQGRIPQRLRNWQHCNSFLKRGTSELQTEGKVAIQCKKQLEPQAPPQLVPPNGYLSPETGLSFAEINIKGHWSKGLYPENWWLITIHMLKIKAPHFYPKLVLSRECMFLGSLSCHNKNLEWQTLKPLGGPQLSEDRPCYSSQV